MIRLLYLNCFLAAALFLVSCDKDDDGDVKPDPATATAIYSDWFRPTPYTKDTLFGIWGFYYDKAAPEITSQVMDSAVVLTFGKMHGYNAAIWPTNQIGQLPIVFTYKQSVVQHDFWSASPSVGKLRIKFTNDNNIYTSISDQHEFRYIIIKGGLPMGRGAAMTYEDVCRYYNIPE